MWKEFKPAIRFLFVFLAIYFVGNIVYGLYIESFGERADKITLWVGKQSVGFISLFDAEVTSAPGVDRPTMQLQKGSDTIVNFYEGCNGVNVMIVFVAFIFAFKSSVKAMAWFIPLGLVVIHFFNLVRIGLLFSSAQHNPQLFYYFHKYIFTAFIYAIVFLLWWIWVMKVANPKSVQSAGQ